MDNSELQKQLLQNTAMSSLYQLRKNEVTGTFLVLANKAGENENSSMTCKDIISGTRIRLQIRRITLMCS